MPIRYSVLPDRDLAVVIYEGEISASERAAAMAEIVRHRNFRPDQMHLVDLSAVTGWEPELEHQVQSGDVAQDWGWRDARQTLCVYYAPTEPARTLANVLARVWADNPRVVPLVLDDEAQALAILGQSELRVAEVRAAA